MVRKACRKELGRIFAKFRDIPSALNFSNLVNAMCNYQTIRNQNWILKNLEEVKEIEKVQTQS